MAVPTLRNRGTVVQTYGDTLTLPLNGTAHIGDLIVIYTENIVFDSSSNAAGVATPNRFVVLYESLWTSGNRHVFYSKVTEDGFPEGAHIHLNPVPGMLTGRSWWGFADTFANVSWRTPGWLALPGGVGNYYTHTRADVGAITSLGFTVRVRFDELDVDQWMIGWKNGDAGFGLDASNRPIVYVKNTLGNRIGNVPGVPVAYPTIPGIVVGRRMWLRGIVYSTGLCQYYYSHDNVEQYDAVRWTHIDNPTGTGGGTTIRVSNSDTVFVGTSDASTAAMVGRIYSYGEYQGNASPHLFKTLSDPLDDFEVVVGDADHIRPTSDDGDGSPIEDWQVGPAGMYTSPPTFYVPGRTAYGADRLWYNAWVGAQNYDHTVNPVSGPADWTTYPDGATAAHQFRYKQVTRTRTVDEAGVYPNAGAMRTGTYSWLPVTLMIRGTTMVVELPPAPLTEQLRLGCAETYTAWITDETYERTIEQVRWSDIAWSRVLDDISQASVTIPDDLGGVNCVARYGGLEPWRYGLYLERDDRAVWQGPIVSVRRDGTNIQIGAADILARYQKRFLSRSPAEFRDTDAVVALKEIIETHAHLDVDAWELKVPDCYVGVAISRSLKPREFKYAWDVISELFDTAIDAYVANGRLYLFDPMGGWCFWDGRTRTLPGPYNTNFDLVYGTFTEEAWSTRPDWSIDGASQANFVVVPSADSGETGFRTYEFAESVESQARYGVLDTVDPESLDIPDDTPAVQVTQALRARARSVLALRAVPPVVVEGGVLSQDAPVDVDNLRPGSLWKMDVYDAGYGHLLTVGRLRRVNVSVSMSDSGLVEKVSATLYPPGWEGQL